MQTTSPLFKRFHDLTLADLNVEMQMHTTQTDGKASVREILQTASERGLSTVAFTEHVRRDTAWFADFYQEVHAAAAEFPELIVYAGCEAKALDTAGGFDMSDEVGAQSDIVLGSVHRMPDGQGGLLDFKLQAQTPAEMARLEFELSLGMLRFAPIDVLAHPGGMYQRHVGPFPRELFREMMQVSLERGIAFEINSSYLRDVDTFLELCDEVNPFVSIGSDVHRLDEVGRCRDMLLASGRFSEK